MENNKQLPDWNTAPEWAMYRAVDSDGGAYYYSDEPKLQDASWVLTEFSNLSFIGFVGSANWRESLERRPENTAPTPDELTQMCGPNYELWEYLHDELGVIALDGQIGDIIEIVRRIEQKRKEQI